MAYPTGLMKPLKLRAIRTPEYLYIRNFIPQLPLIQPNFYTDQSEIMKALNAANREMELNEVQSVFFKPAAPLKNFMMLKTIRIRSTTSLPILLTKTN
jgi:hypothetical protein